MHEDIGKYEMFESPPTNWRDLQNKVAKVFSDLGYESEVEKDIITVRGKVNIDVYAENKKEIPKSIVLGECKHWSKCVPKSIVHSFRTVVSDYGANFGIIISNKGFQSGAYEAAESSNIELLSWQEFQERFLTKWLEKVINDTDKIGRPLWHFTNYTLDFYDNELNKLSKEKQEKFFESRRRYAEFAFYSIKDMYLSRFTGEIEYLDKAIDERKLKLPIAVNSYIDYFDFIKHYCIDGLSEFDELFGKKVRRH